MIIDSLENAEKYTGVHPLFAKAFEWIKNQDLNTIEEGKFDLGEGLKASVSNKQGVTADVAKFECHNNWIDIQVCISARETMGWTTRSKCANPAGEYNAEKDVLFYNDKPGMYFDLQANQFAVFFPEDVHAPMIGEGPIKKLVIKVKK
jgi:biofilm protein TabA